MQNFCVYEIWMNSLWISIPKISHYIFYQCTKYDTMFQKHIMLFILFILKTDDSILHRSVYSTLTLQNVLIVY